MSRCGESELLIRRAKVEQVKEYGRGTQQENEEQYDQEGVVELSRIHDTNEERKEKRCPSMQIKNVPKKQSRRGKEVGVKEITLKRKTCRPLKECNYRCKR